MGKFKTLEGSRHTGPLPRSYACSNNAGMLRTVKLSESVNYHRASESLPVKRPGGLLMEAVFATLTEA